MEAPIGRRIGYEVAFCKVLKPQGPEHDNIYYSHRSLAQRYKSKRRKQNRQYLETYHLGILGTARKLKEIEKERDQSGNDKQ